MEIKNEADFTRIIKCRDTHTESSAEYILPDYLGDVRRILFTSVSVKPAGTFLGSDKVECSGILVYDIIYLDAEDKLSAVQFTSEYDYDLKCPVENCRDAISDTRVSAYSIRLSGPRKIAAKASLTGEVRLTAEDKLSLEGDTEDAGEDRELATRPVKLRSTARSSVTERECAEAVAKLDSAIAEEVSVVFCDASAEVESIEASEDELTLKGKLRMTAVIKNGENNVFSAEKLMNFQESLPFENAEGDMKFIPDVTVTSLKSNVNPCEDGCEIVLSCIMELSALGEKNNKMEIITDGYLKSRECTNQYGEFCFSEFLDLVTASGNHSASLPRSEITSGKLREVIFITAEPRVENIIKDDEGIKILGDIVYSGVASEMDEEGNIGFAMIKFGSPFATNVNIDCQNPEKLTYEAKVKARAATASIDAENLYTSCTVEASVVFCQERSEKVLLSMTAQDAQPYEKCASTIRVYYPTAEDTLFSVARRYHTSPIKIAADNSLSESVMSRDGCHGNLAGVKKLIIY